MAIQGTIRAVAHVSESLEGNALGDPYARDVHVYLPPEYVDATRRFPVVYCLTGFTGTGLMYMNVEPWTPSLPERLEGLRAQGLAEPMILVMPDCFTRLGGSQYINSTATGSYEDYLVGEIVPMIDARFRTLADPAHRAVMGKSSGGYGAIVHAMKHPELFGAVACHSGDMYFEYCYLPDFPKAINGLRKRGGVHGFLEHFDHEAKKSSESMDVLNILAMSACYSPNPLSPALGIDLPFHEETGEMRPEIWERWLPHDPIRMLAGRADALRGFRLVYLDCGTRDEWNLHIGARIFTSRLRALGIAHVHEEFDDGHMRVTYRYERSLSLISQAIAG
jgi:enterochelin esterase family protein